MSINTKFPMQPFGKKGIALARPVVRDGHLHRFLAAGKINLFFGPCNGRIKKVPLKHDIVSRH